MNKKETVFLALSLAVVLIFDSAAYRALAPRSAPEAPEPSGEQTAEAAPEFTVYDAEGNAVRLSDFSGQNIVVNVWATWCPPCRSELPEFESAWRERGGEIAFLMIDLTGGSETQETAEAFLAENGYTFPVYYDLDGSAAEALGIYSIPVTVTVDRDGNLTASRIGALTGEQLTALLDALTQQ